MALAEAIGGVVCLGVGLWLGRMASRMLLRRDTEPEGWMVVRGLGTAFGFVAAVVLAAGAVLLLRR